MNELNTPASATLCAAARFFGRDPAVIHRITQRRPEIATRIPSTLSRWGYVLAIDVEALAVELDKRPRRPRPQGETA